MDYATVQSIRRKLQGSEWVLLDVAWKARHNLLKVLHSEPLGLSASASGRYKWFVSFVESLFADIVWHFRASDGYARLNDEEREMLEAEVFEIPRHESAFASCDGTECGHDPAEELQFAREAAPVLPMLTPDQRHYLFCAWQVTQRITEAVNTPLDLVEDGERVEHEERVRELSHHHVQMRRVLESLEGALNLPLRLRQRIAALLQVRFDEAR